MIQPRPLKILRIDSRRENVHEAMSRLRRQLSPQGDVVSQHGRRRTMEIFGEPLTPLQVVRKICHDVQQQGLAAVLDYSLRIDNAPLTPETLRVPQRELAKAHAPANPEFLETVRRVRQQIREFQEAILHHDVRVERPGGYLRERYRPLDRVGLCVPGGAAAYPSTVLMTAVPAQVAGVKEIALAVPPQRGTGEIAPIILAAAALIGVDEVYAMGGAQAIGALAYGTESIPAVDKIFGPGNLFVTLAKKQVFGVVGIDGLAGPTETVVVADEFARPAWVAADLLAQAEHDVLASAILLTPSQKLAEAVQVEVGRQMETLPRAEIVAQSLKDRSGIVVTQDLAEAVELSNAYGPEHLCLAVQNPWAWSEKVMSAGGIFMGEYSFEVLGDYIAGPSHVMPTSGTARFASPLNVWDFVHIISLIALDESVGQELSKSAALIARSEGLEAHARAADQRAL